ncbi:GntP family permease [Mariniphaga sp.]|uniref:GntP family permease n=1 Tax=Mariniphaga sp. TaxID=1954475 RepID=UPI0035690A84
MDPILIILAGTVVVLFCIIVLKLHAVISLLIAAMVTGLLTSPELIYNYAVHSGVSEQEAQSMSAMGIGTRLATAFGNTSGKIGILIAFASIIGTSLMKSGAAERIVRGLLQLFGKKNTSLALLSGSFTLAIPVFFDTVFYLMIPIVKSMGVRNPKKFGLYLMAVIAGGVMAHSLVPPTPGPLFVAEEMGIDIGTMIIGGLVIGIITVAGGYAYSVWVTRKWDLPMRDTPDISMEDLKKFSDQENKDLPRLWISVFPILLPIVLITGNTISKMLVSRTNANLNSFQQGIAEVFATVGDANIALAISSFIALYLLWSKIKEVPKFKKFVFESLTSAGIIILITASGGAFGQMMQQTGIGIRIEGLAANYHMALLPMAFFITAAVRTAQGSATVAMVTAIGIMSGLAGSGLQFHPVYLAMAIGCGSKIFAWMNDSGYWIITKMSGMEEKETIRYFSMLLLVMGFTGLIAVMILSKVLPLV